MLRGSKSIENKGCIYMKDVKQVIVVRKDLNMRKGKIAAQVSHASLNSVLNRMHKFEEKWCLYIDSESAFSSWLHGLFTKVVLSIDNEEQLKELMCEASKNGIQVTGCIDIGKTEFHGVATLTCAAFGPDYPDKIDLITGHLKLL